MTASEHSELMDVIDRTFVGMGGKGTLEEVLAVLLGGTPAHLRDYLLREGLATKVRGYFRRKSTHEVTAEARVYLDEGMRQAVTWWVHLYKSGLVIASVSHHPEIGIAHTTWDLDEDDLPTWLPEPPAWWTAALDDLRAQGERIKAGAS